MFRRTDARRVGFRAPELKLHDPDVLELWYRLLQIGECRVIGEPLYYYRVRLGSLTHGARGRTAREYHDAVRAFYDPDGWSRLPSRPMLDDNNARSRVVSRAWEYYAWAGDFDAAREAAWKGLRSQPVNLRYWNLLLKAACRRATWRAPNGQNLTAKFRVPVNDELPQSLQIPQPA